MEHFYNLRAELAAKELISFLQRESNFRSERGRGSGSDRVGLVAVFVSSQMAGLFIHFIRERPNSTIQFYEFSNL